MSHTDVTIIGPLPNCDFCLPRKVPALYDAATKMGPWANLCQRHFEQYALGLGLGRGQRLHTREES